MIKSYQKKLKLRLIIFNKIKKYFFNPIEPKFLLKKKKQKKPCKNFPDYDIFQEHKVIDTEEVYNESTNVIIEMISIEDV